MHVINARGVNEALYLGINYLSEVGIKRDSRNGPVKMAPTPVTTVYERPLERVLFSPERDANCFLHLYESLWMINGRNDVEPLVRYAAQMKNYSDDGVTLHGAYGYRWRQAFQKDQLKLIAEALQRNKEDRRQVLQMWDTNRDLDRLGKDLPCNTIATFQVNTEGSLDLTVFCRSNDIIWGAYGANAVHFSFLLEYMAKWIGIPVGRLYQVSVNWHAYLEVFEPLAGAFKNPIGDRYDYRYNIEPLMMRGSIEEIDKNIADILENADSGQFRCNLTGWARAMSQILLAHHLWRTLPAPERYEKALMVLEDLHPNIDFVAAAKDWIARRATKWMQKMVAK